MAWTVSHQVAVVVGVALGGGTVGRASECRWSEACAHAVEIAIPDLSYELGGERSGLVLALPATAQVRAWSNGAPNDCLMCIMEWSLRAWAEPQYAVAPRAWRGLAGLRLYGGQAVVGRIEAGGLLGTDGNGTVVGAGVGFGDVDLFVLSLGYRFVWTPGHTRHVVLLDLEPIGWALEPEVYP